MVLPDREEIRKFIRNSIERYGYGGAVIGISGGIDSAVAGALLVDALGPGRVFGLLMPERDSAGDTPQTRSWFATTWGSSTRSGRSPRSSGVSGYTA